MERTATYSSQVMMSAYAALLFFAPMIQRQFRDHEDEYGEKEKSFILGWCQVGNFFLGLLVIILIFWSIGEGFRLSFFVQSAEFFALVLAILIGLCGVLVGVGEVFESRVLDMSWKQKKELILCFFPGWAGIQRHKHLKEGKNIWWLKEGQLWRMMIVLTGVFSSHWYQSVVILLILIMRCLSLGIGYDVIRLSWKQYVNTRYQIYVEEIFIKLLMNVLVFCKLISQRLYDLFLLRWQERVSLVSFYSGWWWNGCLCLLLGGVVYWSILTNSWWKLPLIVIWIVRIYRMKRVKFIDQSVII